MTTRRREPGGSWWWAGGGAGGGGGGGGESQPGGGEFMFGGMSENQCRRREFPALGGYQLQEVPVAAQLTGTVAGPYQQPRDQCFIGQQDIDSDIFQLSYPRPRLRWTAELHDQFVKAVNELGGANS